MKKKDRKLIDVVYALIFQFIFIPLMGFLTYSVYNNLFYTEFIQNNVIMASILIFVLLFINLGILYGIAYLFNKIYKMNLITYVITGLITIFGGLWFLVYYYALVKTSCLPNSSLDCLGATKDYNVFLVGVIMAVAYYLVYIVLHKMVEKKLSMRK